MEGWAKPGGLVERKGGVGLEAMSGGHSFREFCCNTAEGNEAPVGGKANLRKNLMTQKGWE